MVNVNYLLSLVINTVIVPVLSISATAGPVANLAFAFQKVEHTANARASLEGCLSIAPGSDSCQSLSLHRGQLGLRLIRAGSRQVTQ